MSIYFCVLMKCVELQLLQYADIHAHLLIWHRTDACMGTEFDDSTEKWQQRPLEMDFEKNN